MPCITPLRSLLASPRARRRVGSGVLIATTALLASLVAGCRREARTAVASATAAALPAKTSFASSDCRTCHAEIHKTWSESHHAHAHRLPDPARDGAEFAGPRSVLLHGIDYTVGWKDQRPTFTEKRPEAAAEPYSAEFVLGHTPLQQFIVPTGRGHYQVAELSYDPGKKEWFNVFGDERRRPGEWGHWRGRGMNWNSMCAHCHVTEFRKNYDVATDTYSSAWREHGVGCIQCHGDLPADHIDPQRRPAAPRGRTAADLRRAQETCAPCHARNELLTGVVRPGVAYADHYRLTLPTDAAVFYPDGQVRDEDFNYTSLLTSRMGGKAGVTCLDCHEPHNGRTLLPVENNQLCLRCHSAPGPQSGPLIDPVAHSRHQSGSKGNQCISCHMPTTTYMQRDPRHDHGFIKPDPLLTRELGIPNACNRCHTDQSVDWAIGHSERWYGAKLDSRQRERTRVVAAAQAHAPEAAAKLLALLASEEIPAWRATLLLLARNYLSTHPDVAEIARKAASDIDPMVRSAAAQVLSGLPQETAALRALLDDPVRLVRLDAAWPLSPTLPADSRARRELETYLAVIADQPAGRMRIGQDLFNRGRAAEAEAHLRQAVAWDPNSAGLHETLGLILNELGKSSDAAAALWRSARLNPADASAAFNAALAFAGAQKLNDAELALREALHRDPRLDRAWYNLGLLLAQTNRLADGLAAIEAAERIAARVADYPFARATLLWQKGDHPAALVAARRALEIDPNHGRAREFLRRAER